MWLIVRAPKPRQMSMTANPRPMLAPERQVFYATSRAGPRPAPCIALDEVKFSWLIFYFSNLDFSCAIACSQGFCTKNHVC